MFNCHVCGHNAAKTELVGEAIQIHDRLLIALSELGGEWVMTEIRKAREAEDNVRGGEDGSAIRVHPWLKWVKAAAKHGSFSPKNCWLAGRDFVSWFVAVLNS